MMDMGKKWRENRIRLFHTKFDKTLSREENIRNPPLSIPPTEWAAFIDYRLEEDTMVLFYLNFKWFDNHNETYFIWCLCVEKKQTKCSK